MSIVKPIVDYLLFDIVLMTFSLVERGLSSVCIIDCLVECGLPHSCQSKGYLMFLHSLLDSVSVQYFPTVGKVIKQTLSTIDQG